MHVESRVTWRLPHYLKVPGPGDYDLKRSVFFTSTDAWFAISGTLQFLRIQPSADLLHISLDKFTYILVRVDGSYIRWGPVSYMAVGYGRRLNWFQRKFYNHLTAPNLFRVDDNQPAAQIVPLMNVVSQRIVV